MNLPIEYFSNMYICYYYGSLIRCSSNWKGIDAVSPYNKIYYILDGECFIEIDGVKYGGKKGTLCLIPAGAKHSFYHYNDNFIKKYWFHFVMQFGGNNFFDMIQVPHFIDVGTNPKIKRIFKEIVTANDNNLHGLLHQKSRIIEIIALYLSLFKIEFVPANASYKELANVLQYIKENLKNQITIAELAEIAHLHPNYFIRLFKEKLGTSPAKYISNLRIEQTKTLLENTSIPINEIMQDVGFDDLSHFSKFFKQYSGHSPKQFREIYRK